MNEQPRHRWWQALTENVVRLSLAVATLLLCVNLVRSVQRNYQVSQQIRMLRSQVTQQQQAIERTSRQNDYYRTETFRELEARRRLGFVLPGEQLVLVPDNRDAPAAAAGAAAADQENDARVRWSQRPAYEQWWLLFFGPQQLLEEVFGA